MVAYTYDAWGNPLTTTGTMADTLGKLDPFRYRGYVYDTETGLYYLGSRYYNPQWGRFVNADSESLVTASPDSAIWDKNLFAYCDNNPITRIDANGGWWHVAIGAAVGVIAQYATDVTINLRQGKSFIDALSPRSSLFYMAQRLQRIKPQDNRVLSCIKNHKSRSNVTRCGHWTRLYVHLVSRMIVD